jgi:hypothetical protein
MPSPVLALSRLCSIALLFALADFRPSFSATFPLPTPTRPTTFPLPRPTLSGEVVAWGANNDGQISVPAGLTDVVAISAAYRSSAALRRDGTVVVWGSNPNGQLTPPPTVVDIVSISMGPGHCLALKSNGTVIGWGVTGGTPWTPPAGLSSVVSISAGNGHSLALKSNGQVVGWGGMAAPAEITDIVGITAGAGVSLAVRSDGTVATWGANNYLPIGVTDVVATASEVDDGSYRSMFLRSDGSLALQYGYPHRLPLNLKATKIAMSFFNNAAITPERTLVVWAANEDPYANVVTNIPPRLRNVIDVAMGRWHILALKLPSPPIPSTARATPQIVNGFVVGLNLIDGGEGYSQPPLVRIVGGNGTGAAVEAHISQGIVTGFTITDAGRGYSGSTTVEIDAPPLLPYLSIAPTRVGVTMQVLAGRRYLLEAADELPNFTPVGEPFTAESDSITREFVIRDSGQFFRIQEIAQ